ncbi:MAG: histidine phosphatase family protein [Pseudomonadota bacterium]
MRLYILRHAKSSWAETGAKDFDRGLNERGSSDLRKIAAELREREYLPPQVYCSPALRTRLTMHGIILAYDDAPNIDYVDKLYSGDTLSYVDCIRRHPERQDLMIVGHNPMCAEIALQLIGDGEPKHLQAVSNKYPTGALAVIDFDIDDWNAIATKSGYITDFMLPREL